LRMSDDERRIVCANCGETWGRWFACPACGCKYVVPPKGWTPRQLHLFVPERPSNGSGP
jgi:DNA-directed RNA polymerase subunit RPC12/RpoP